MLELTSLGGGKMHSRSIEFAKKYRVRLRVRPGFNDTLGTLICPEADDDGPIATGLALVKDEVRVSLCDIPDRPGVMSLIFAKMAQRKISIDMVVQDVASGGLAQVSFTVPQNDLAETLTAAEEAVTELGAGMVQHGTNVAKVSSVGTGMRHHTGVAAVMFQALADQGISIGMITTGDIKISCLVDRSRCLDALKAVHDGFKLHEDSAVAPLVGWEAKPEATLSHHSRDELERDVVSRLAHMEDIVVSEVLLDADQSRVSIRNLPDEPGVAAKIFTAVAEGGVMVDMIVQNISQRGHANLSFTVLRKDLDQCLLLVREVLEPWRDAALSFERDIAKLSVMGIGLRSHTGVGEKMFRALAGANVNIQMVSTSEIRISAVVSPADGQPALQALLKTFD